MSYFYFHREHLQDHIDQLSRQTRQVQHLQDCLYQLSLTADSESCMILRRNIHRLEEVKKALDGSRRVLLRYLEDVSDYSLRLSDKMDNLILDGKHLFD